MTLRRFSSVKNFGGFTLRALAKRSPRRFYLDSGDLKSMCKVQNTGKNVQAEDSERSSGLLR